MPKEMLPVVDKPLIQYAVEEAYAAGVREMIFVTSRHKRAIEDHFDRTFELEDALEKARQGRAARRRPRGQARRHGVRLRAPGAGARPRPRGAVRPPSGRRPPVRRAAARRPDDRQRRRCWRRWSSSSRARRPRSSPCRRCRPSTPGATASSAGAPSASGWSRSTGIVEKPAPEVAPSRLGVAGRYILTPRVFDEIAAQPRGVGGEIQLTDGIAGLLRHEKVFAYRYEGRRYDCGSKEGFLQANVELALEHPELGPEFRAYLRAL